MTETVVITLLFMWILKGYKLSDIIKPFKHWTMYPIILTCFIHIYLIYLMIHEEYWFVQYSNYIKIISFLFYLILIWKYKLLDISIFDKINKKKNQLLIWLTSPVTLGGLCILIGSKLNQIAMYYNQNKMPVFPDVSFSTGYTKLDMFNKMSQFKDWHVIGNSETNLIFLTDIYDGFFTIMSFGDLIIRGFVIFTIYYSIKRCNEINIIH